jgi:DNA-binding XRE family transcriptional regulator
MFAKGLSAVFISHELTNMGKPISPEALLAHKKHYLPPINVAAKSEKDLAILVRDRTIEAIEEGRLEPNIRDGLTAQGLLDRRIEKVDDRNTALALARLLSGRTDASMLLAPDNVVVIEGTYSEATDA